MSSSSTAREHGDRRRVSVVDWTSVASPTASRGLESAMFVGRKTVHDSSRRSSVFVPREPSNLQRRRSSVYSQDGFLGSRRPSIATQPVGKSPAKFEVPPTSGMRRKSKLKPKTNSRRDTSDEEEPLERTITSEMGTLTSEMGTIARIYHTIDKPEAPQDEKTESKFNKETLDLLYKIKQSVKATSIGPVPLSQQACRFELPFDLKLLETLTPLEYLSKYCRLSSRRQYQFKRVFHKYRNARHLVESSDLFQSIVDIHHENFTRTNFADLAELIDLGSQPREFTLQTFGGILAFCERRLYNTSPALRNYDGDQLSKDPIEKCDFDSMQRKLDGLSVSETMKRLLDAL